MHTPIATLRTGLLGLFLFLAGWTTSLAQTQPLDPNFRIPPSLGAQIEAQLTPLLGADFADEAQEWVDFFAGRTTLGQMVGSFLQSDFSSTGLFGNVTASTAQVNQLTTAFLSGSYTSYVDAVNSVVSGAGWTRVNANTWSQGNATVEIEDQVIYDSLFQAFSLFSTLGDFGSTGADSVSANLTQDLFTSSIFDKVAPASVAAAKKEKDAPAAQITTVFGADAFYTRTKYDGGGSAKVYGTNLSMTWGGRTQVRATVPIYKADYGTGDATTYGLDLNARHALTDSFAVGAHANYFQNDTDFGNSTSWGAGLYAAAVARTSETSRLSLGALLDHVKPEGADSSWIAALGVNWGFVAGQKSSLNPYVIAYQLFDAPAGADKNWYDLGLELQVNPTETWTFKLGLKTTLGQTGVDSSYQAYLGSAWRF